MLVGGLTPRWKPANDYLVILLSSISRPYLDNSLNNNSRPLGEGREATARFLFH